MDGITREIEQAFVGHWSLLGQWPGAALVEERGCLRFETPIAELPYNGVIRSQLDGDVDGTIDHVLGSFRARGVQCMWIVHPSARPGDLGGRLEARGLRPVEHVTGMSLELDAWTSERVRPGVRYGLVADARALGDYEDMIVTYWELPDQARAHVSELSRFWAPGLVPAHRWVACDDGGRPIGKALLSLAAPAGVAAIYGMSVRPEARGRGVARGLTVTLLKQARELGCRRVVLHSSEMAVGLYVRAGFVERCSFAVYATAQLWSKPEH